MKAIGLRGSNILACILATVLWVGAAIADDAPGKGDPFLRIQKNESGTPLSMDTAVVRYTGKDPRGNAVTVDLVGAVHIGEPSYYEELNKRFQGYDSVLYELIIPEGQAIPKNYKKRSDNVVSTLQQGMKQLLGLEFQLEAVDYHVPNMVHADLTVEAFESSMKARGESIWTLFLRLILQSMSEQQKKASSGNELLLLLSLLQDTSDERAFTLRRYLAENFSQIEEISEKIEGPKGSAIIADRNKRALEVLKEQIGKGKRHVAIFYGAAHLPDFDRQLRSTFNFTRTTTEWIPAWTLSPIAVRKSPAEQGK